MEVIKTEIGPFVIYNRDEENEEFDEPLMGPGTWHFGRCDEEGNFALYRIGYMTRDRALHAMHSYIWAQIYDMAWT